MLSVFKRLLGQNAEADPSGVPARKLQRLRRRHRPDLVADLRDQHRELLRLFAELERACEQDNAGACRATLDRFAAALEDHLALENLQLYSWFSRNVNPDPDMAQRIEMMTTDMMHVGRILQRFIATHARAPLEPARLHGDLRAIGEVLAHRIHEEETVLYPLYAPPTR